jgi:Protein of unknown function (DUF3626)
LEIKDTVQRALDFVRQRSPRRQDNADWPITLNFHPDMSVDGRPAIELMARHGTYRSQFETGTSSGGLTAHVGGDRWNWESRIFGQAYDNADVTLRPKYGALNHRRNAVGGSRRFGSSHLRLHAHLRARTSFCYPDSHFEPQDFAIDDVRPLVALADGNARSLDPWLDNYIEAHVHGPLVFAEDVEALVLDPSFRGTSVEESARALGCPLEWHDGFYLSLDRLSECRAFRGPAAADAIVQIAEGSLVTPETLWRARDSVLDYQTAKWVWHCMARYGHQ